MGDFTAHNVRYPDGTVSKPGHPTLLADEPLCRATMRLIKTMYGPRVVQKSIVDLGCLEGGYTAEFARLGMRALGIEVRQSNYDNCLEVKNHLRLPALEFAKDDCWNVGKYGQHDVVFCCGLLYHLDRPYEFVKLMGQVANDILIINTHYAPHEDEHVFGLSPLTENEGMPGRWFSEHGDVDLASLDQMKWASWTNSRSFWMTREAHFQALSDAGFDLVLEQWDWPSDPASLMQKTSSPEFKSFLRAGFIGIRSYRVHS